MNEKDFEDLEDYVPKKRKTKDPDDIKTIESVLDYETALILYRLQNKGIIGKLHGIIQQGSGKEANVYCADAGPQIKLKEKDFSATQLAIKIYRTRTLNFKKIHRYIQIDPRFKKYRHTSKQLMRLWASKEYRNLKRAYNADVRVATPIMVRDNVLIMEFLGKQCTPYPLLKFYDLEEPQIFFEQLLIDLKKLYRKAKIIHGDLSEFNILVKTEDETPYLIDFSQSLSFPVPMPEIHFQYYLRDLVQITKFFSNYLENLDVIALYQEITNEKFPRRFIPFLNELLE